MQRVHATVCAALPLPKCLAQLACSYHFYLTMRFARLRENVLASVGVKDMLLTVDNIDISVLDLHGEKQIYCEENTCGYAFAVAVHPDRVALLSRKQCVLLEVSPMRLVGLCHVSMGADLRDRVAVIGARVFCAQGCSVMELDFVSKFWKQVIHCAEQIQSIAAENTGLVVAEQSATHLWTPSSGRFVVAHQVAHGIHKLLTCGQRAELPDGSRLVCTPSTLFILRNNEVWAKMEHRRDIRKIWPLTDGRVVCVGRHVYLLK
jgi:hypothetical protein